MNKKYVYTSFFVLLLVICTSLFTAIVSPFIVDIFLAIVLTHIFLPIKKSLSGHVPSTIAALLTVAAIIFIVIIPLLTISVMLTSELTMIYNRFIENWPQLVLQIKNHEYFKYVSEIPVIGKEITEETKLDFIKSVGKSVGSVATYSFTFAKSLVVNITTITVHFLFTMLLTFYFLIGHDRVSAYVRQTIPLDVRDVDEIYYELQNTGDATINGTFLIGIIEGVFGAILLTIAGVDATVLWGVVMFFLSMIPLIGITVILIPFALYFLLSGSIGTGLFVLIIGISGVTFTQNILKPKLVGGRSGLHQGIVLISSIGGITMFGVIGFIIGPLIATMFFVLWKQFRTKYEGKPEVIISSE